jgi:hypothetical protein
VRPSADWLFLAAASVEAAADEYALGAAGVVQASRLDNRQFCHSRPHACIMQHVNAVAVSAVCAGG